MPAKKKRPAKKAATKKAARKKTTKKTTQTKSYRHNDKESLIRPEIGTLTHFKKLKKPVTYRYDKSLDPEMSWDINADREYAEALIEKIRKAESIEEAKKAAEELKRMSQPFLNWAGKAEKNQFSVPTLPLFVHERLSTQAILETLKGHKRNHQIEMLFSDPQLDMTDRITKAYEHKDKWVNRMILGDSLLVMNSLLQYESMAGKVQMIYMDPPYGVKFGSNFQPFIRKKEVKHNEDRDFTREPEMVQAYRDTWELGLHSYLTYIRDRMQICKELLHPSGSIFVQISDENVHHVRELMDEVFGADNFCGIIQFAKTSGLFSTLLYQVCDYILWYSPDKSRVKYNQLYSDKIAGEIGASKYSRIELSDGTRRSLTSDEKEGSVAIPEDARFWVDDNLTSQGNPLLEFEYNGKMYKGTYKTNPDGMTKLAKANRLYEAKGTLRFVRYLDDFPVVPLNTAWMDIGGIQSRSAPKIYAVQTSTVAIQRCMLMTTNPGDLVLDPTCGSGTTAYVGEQWGRRWITIDTSRVPLALVRQRLLSATFSYYELLDDNYGIGGGFKYERKRNQKGEEVGGIVPHVTLKSIAQNESLKEEVIVDRPNITSDITRVSGPFVFEATIPTPIEIGKVDKQSEYPESGEIVDYKTRMLETLKKVATLRIGNNSIVFRYIKSPAKSLSIHAVAEQVEKSLEDLGEDAAIQKSLSTKAGKSVAFVFGPENGAVTDKLVYEAAREAHGRNFKHLYVIGFAIQDAATKLISQAETILDIPVSYVSASMDLQMGDLLKDQRSSQIFAVTGMPDVRLTKLKMKSDEGEILYQVELLGLDTFDPITMETLHLSGDDVPAWFLDCDYNELAFCVNQAFFPRTTAWDNLKKSLKGEYDDSVWDHLAGAISEPFPAGEDKKIAVKVIDDRGNELMIVKELKDAANEK